MNKINRIKIDLQLLYFLTLKEFKLRYKNSFIGYIWAVLNPLAFASVYFFAFKLVMKFDIENYSMILLTGLFPWVWINTSLSKGALSFVANSGIIKKISFNYNMIPISMIMHDFVHFLFSIPILIIYILVTGMDLHFSYLIGIPILLITQIIMLIPFVTILSTFNVFIRDVEYLTSVALSLLFFLTPIVYPIDIVPEKFLHIYMLNPFVYLIELWRELFLNGKIIFKNVFIILSVFVPFSIICRKIAKSQYKRFSEYL
ncbi:O-antigen export system permease protein RfbA [beta proteobacterium KB13]|uniref:Transport permease protein n=1 Tax=beta proteobacterium KB13 TaxID=314607 RepID=B6BTL9_9PROT|nr:O-antigen export system permease protein RfbA [beta proteobacterium KB13]